MRRAIFISILLTFCTIAGAQESGLQKPVRLVFTAHFQQHPVVLQPSGREPVWGSLPEASMAKAMSYIRSHRRAMGEDSFALIACGETAPSAFALYPENFAGRILDYGDYVKPGFFTLDGQTFRTVVFDREDINDPTGDRSELIIGLFPSPDTDLTKIARTPGVRLAVAGFGREPEVCRVVNTDRDTVTVINMGTSGKYIGVADFTEGSGFTVKTVDISAFPVDAEYMEHFRELSDSIRRYYHAPLTTISETVHQFDALFGPSAYTEMFHRFQLETTGADISFFAAPVWGDSISAGAFTPRDLLRRFRYDNRLCVVELTGKEIVAYLEYTYGQRYHTLHRSTDDLLRLTRDREGRLRPRTAVYNLDDAAGIRYEVDISRPQGRRIKVLSMVNGTPFEVGRRYRVALNSHRLQSGYLTRACGLPTAEILRRTTAYPRDMRVMLQTWLQENDPIIPVEPENWRVVPESFVQGRAHPALDE